MDILTALWELLNRPLTGLEAVVVPMILWALMVVALIILGCLAVPENLKAPNPPENDAKDGENIPREYNLW